MTERRPHQLAERLLALGGMFIALMIVAGDFGQRILQLWMLLGAIVAIAACTYFYSKEDKERGIVIRLNEFHKTRLGYLVFGLVELGLAYAVASWAVDNGSLWLWILTLILFIGFLQNVGRLAISLSRVTKH